jgi:hypothetical protein
MRQAQQNAEQAGPGRCIQDQQSAQREQLGQEIRRQQVP